MWHGMIRAISNVVMLQATFEKKIIFNSSKKKKKRKKKTKKKKFQIPKKKKKNEKKKTKKTRILFERCKRKTLINLCTSWHSKKLLANDLNYK